MAGRLSTDSAKCQQHGKLLLRVGTNPQFCVPIRAKDFSKNSLFLLAPQRETAVERCLSVRKIPKGIRIVIDVENQL